MKRKTVFLISGGAVLCVSLALFALWVLLLFIYNTSNVALFIGYRSSGSDLYCVFFFFFSPGTLLMEMVLRTGEQELTRL